MNELPHGPTRRRLLAGVAAGFTASLLGASSSAAQTQTETDGEQLAFGETFVSPTDVAVTVNRVELTDSYEWSGNSDTTYTEEPTDGMQFAWIYLAAENRGKEAQYLPLISDVVIRSGNQQFDAEYPLTDQGRYETSQVGTGVVREGWLFYEIPTELSVSDVDVIWYGSNFVEDWTATWSNDSSSGTTSPTGTSQG